MGFIRNIRDKVQGKVPSGYARSSHWEITRRAHLLRYPKCAACGGTKNVEVHHIMPFHLRPALELDPTNLVTLCESKKNGVNCHLLIGHLGSFQSFNLNVVKDAHEWILKIMHRPKGDGTWRTLPNHGKI